MFDALLIQNGGVLSNDWGCIGCGGSSNAAIVNGGTWSNSADLYVGSGGAGNRLVISNHGVVFDAYGVLGFAEGASSNNSALVTGSGSVWSHQYVLTVGYFGAGNHLVISNGGAVFSPGAEDSVLGRNASSSNNTVLVTDPGSVWYNNGVFVGSGGAGNRLMISNQGAVFGACFLGSSNNSVLVTGNGSVLTGGIRVGFVGAGNSLVISDSGAVLNSAPFGGIVGFWDSSSNNSVLVTGSGQWQNSSPIYIGYGGRSNVVTIAGGSVLASSAFIGYTDPSYGIASNNAIRVESGSLFVTNTAGNGALVVSRGGKGELILNGGSVTVNSIVATNGSNSVVTFNGGTLNSGGTAVTNSQQFVVGNGTNSATFHLLGGVHSFTDGLCIRTNSFLIGCGTINGSVLVDTGGTVLADCGSTLTLTGSVTNNGLLVVNNASVLESSGTLVNNGKILLFNGGMTNFHGTFVNNGSVLNAGTVLISNVRRSGNDVLIQIPSVTGFTYRLRLTQSLQPQAWSDSGAAQPGNGGVLTFTDPGAATNASSHFYHVRVE